MNRSVLQHGNLAGLLILGFLGVVLPRPTASADCGSLTGAVDLGEDWQFLEWFGAYNEAFCPWLFHAEHEWIFLSDASSPSSTFYFDLEVGWLFTAPGLYPFVYSFDRRGWLFYARDSISPRWFLDLNSEQWFSVPEEADPSSLTFTNPGPGAGTYFMSIAIHPQDSDLFYIGGDIEGPFLSIDGGNSYRRVPGNLAGGNHSANVYAAQQFVFDPSNPNRVYMTSWGGLYRTEDTGQTWSRLPVDPGEEAFGLSIATVAVSPNDSSLILAGIGDVESNGDGTSAIYRSNDDGASFEKVAEGLFAGSEIAVHTIVFRSDSPDQVFAATGEGIAFSADGGLTWELRNNGLPTGSGGTPSMAQSLVEVTDGDAFILFTSLRTQSHQEFIAGGVFRSRDEGQSWTDITGDLPRVQEEDGPLAHSYWRLEVDPSEPNVAYVGTQRDSDFAYDQFGLFKTSNALVANPESVSWRYLWDASQEPFASTDFGWLEPGWWNDLHVSFLAASPSNPNILIAGGEHVFKSTDKGETWTEAYSQRVSPTTWAGRGIEVMEAFDVAVDPNNPDRWWVGYDDMGLFRTDDAGLTFLRLDPTQRSLELGDSDCACFLVTDPDDSNILYVGRNQGENDLDIEWAFGNVWKTEDSGGSWTQLGADILGGNSGEGGRPLLHLLPGGDSSRRTLLAAIYSVGLFRTEDSGASWSGSSSGLNAEHVKPIWSLANHPDSAEIVYAGISHSSLEEAQPDGAIYRSDDSGRSWVNLQGSSVPAGQILSLAVAVDSTVYAAVANEYSSAEEGEGSRRGGLYRSADQGQTWSRVLDQPRVDSVSVSAAAPNAVVAAVSNTFNENPSLNAGIYVSRDAGETFTPENEGLTHTRIWFSRIHSGDPIRVFVGTGGGGLFVGSGLTQ